MLPYITYLVKYSGNLLPPYYIGSTSYKNISSGNYFGSVSSIRWKNIFKNELKNNKELFSVEILTHHKTRKEALEEELKIQIKRGVVKSPFYFNESLATPNGFFGMEMKGENSPSYGKKHSEESKKKMSEARSGKTYEEIYGVEKAKEIKDKASKRFSGKNNPLYGKDRSGKNAGNYGKKHSEEAKKKMSESHKGQISGNKGNQYSKKSKEKIRQSVLGKIWIINLETKETKRIFKEEIEKYLKNGFKKGRK